MTRLFGVDGCPGGWVVAESTLNLRRLDLSITSDLESLFVNAANNGVVAIDIPIGLPVSEPRACDLGARKELGQPRGSSVFPAPARATLSATSYAAAQELNRQALGVGLSRQCFCILPKIRDVDSLMTAERQQYIREAHPEVTFARLGGAPMIHNKKRSEGRAERLAVLEKAGLHVSQTWLAEERNRLRSRRVALDDLVDALACLVTAYDIRIARSDSLGHPEERDAKGLLMEIVTCGAARRSASA